MNVSDLSVLVRNYSEPGPAVNYATHLAKEINRPLTLFAIVVPPRPVAPTAILGSGLLYPVKLDRAAYLEKIEPRLQELSDHLTPIWHKIGQKIHIGDPESRIIHLSDEEAPDFLILEGASNDSTLNEWFGTFASRVGGKTDFPVLIVRPTNTWKPVRNILYLMEAGDARKENLAVLAEVATSLHAHLQVVTIVTDKPSSAGPSLEEAFHFNLGYREASFHYLHPGNSKPEAIEALVKRSKADWLAIEHNSQGFLERILNPAISTQLILQSKIPVLVF